MEKLWKMWKKIRDVKLIPTQIRRNYFVLEPNYHATKTFTECLLAIEMKKTDILMHKLVCLGLPILELNKISMCEFLYDYVKPNYCKKSKIGLYGYR